MVPRSLFPRTRVRGFFPPGSDLRMEGCCVLLESQQLKVSNLTTHCPPSWSSARLSKYLLWPSGDQATYKQ